MISAIHALAPKRSVVVLPQMPFVNPERCDALMIEEVLLIRIMLTHGSDMAHVRAISVEVAHTERAWVISASVDALARVSALRFCACPRSCFRHLGFTG